MEIGKRIQRLRRERSLTQEQLAAALGVTSAAVSKWETNAAIPDVAMLCPLARMLGITVDALLLTHSLRQHADFIILVNGGQLIRGSIRIRKTLGFVCDGKNWK